MAMIFLVFAARYGSSEEHLQILLDKLFHRKGTGIPDKSTKVKNGMEFFTPMFGRRLHSKGRLA